MTRADDFERTRIALDPDQLVDRPTRERLMALPGHLHLHGDAVPLEYEIEGDQGVARVRLRQGQAKRLRVDQLPTLDRPLRFAVQRGRHPPLRADTIPELQALLRRSPKVDIERPPDLGPKGGRRGKRRHGDRTRGGGRHRGRPRR